MITALIASVRLMGNYFAILPSDGSVERVYDDEGKNTHVPQGFAYNSSNNPDFLDVDEIRSLIRKYVMPDFQPR